MTERRALVQIAGQVQEMRAGDSLFGVPALSSTPGTPLGTAGSAGVAMTAARADHVHASPAYQIDGGSPGNAYGGTTAINGGGP